LPWQIASQIADETQGKEKMQSGRIAQGALTNSKRDTAFIRPTYPTQFVKGCGNYLSIDTGVQYLDFLGALGTNWFGYGNIEIAEAIHAQAMKGCLYSLGSDLENEYAQRICEYFPFMDKIKIFKTGSEGCSAAIRMARTYTKRNRVLSEGYHGWHDEFVSIMPNNVGIPHGASMENWDGKLESIDTTQRIPAAIIIEPVALDWSDARKKYLQDLKAICKKHDIVLIFDETITAFRFLKGAVSKCFGVYPDLSIQGKALANGLPISVVGGRREIMDSEYFCSGTFGGELLTLAAAIKCLNLVQNDFNPDLHWERLSEFKKKFNEIDPEIIKMDGYPTRGTFIARDDMSLSIFCEQAVIAKLFFHPKTWFLNRYHIPAIDNVLSISSHIISRIKRGNITLKGEMFSSPFHRIK